MDSERRIVEEHAHLQRKNCRQGAHHLWDLHHFQHQASFHFDFRMGSLMEILRNSNLSENANGKKCAEQDQRAHHGEGQSETSQFIEQTANGGPNNVSDGQKSYAETLEIFLGTV